MALDLNEYIKMSYERPNRKVLEGLGANEKLIEYLMETPGNTNWNVVGSIEGAGGDDDWTVIRINASPEDGFMYTTNTTNWDKLMQLYDDDQDVIISVDYDLHLDASYHISNDSAFGMRQTFEGIHMIVIEVDELGVYELTSVLPDMGSRVIGSPFPAQAETDYIEIKFKTGPSYAINFSNLPSGGTLNLTSYVEVGGSRKITEIVQGSFTDGNVDYFPGDIITPTSNITLTWISGN